MLNIFRFFRKRRKVPFYVHDVLTKVIEFNDDAQMKLHDSLELINAATKLISEAHKPKPPNLRLFNHCAQLNERIKDFGVIAERLAKTKYELIVSEDELKLIRSEQTKKSRELHRKISGYEKNMKVDLECLYSYAIYALDQLFIVITHVHGIGSLVDKQGHPFSYVMYRLLENHPDATRLKKFERKFYSDLIWMHFNLRFYRNKFVTHIVRPVQKGSTASVYGLDFKLKAETPPHTEGRSDLENKIKELEPLLAEEMKYWSEDYWGRKPRAMINKLFSGIDKYGNLKEKEEIQKCFRLMGGYSESYHVIAKKFSDFIHGVSIHMLELIQDCPDDVDLGKRESLDV